MLGEFPSIVNRPFRARGIDLNASISRAGCNSEVSFEQLAPDSDRGDMVRLGRLQRGGGSCGVRAGCSRDYSERFADRRVLGAVGHVWIPSIGHSAL